MTRLWILPALVLAAATASAQPVSHRGFVEGKGLVFPLEAPNDTTTFVGDVLLREDVFVRPSGWLELAAGLDLRANSHGQVEDEWRLDLEDRSILRPRAAVRRLAVTLKARRLTLDLGKQFIRWGRADVVYPTDRFAPRDYMNVIDSELLPVIGARAGLQAGNQTIEAIYVSQLTPSRLPLVNQRWAALPAGIGAADIQDGGADFPDGGQYGVRWRHTGSRLETAVSFFDGFNHHPTLEARGTAPGTIEFVRRYPAIRMYGGDLAVPTSWLTLKAEVAYVTSSDATSDEYVLYVVEVERQVGEWLLDAGYAGEVVREARELFVFSPDRGMAKSIIGRASYAVDPRRTVIIEGAARQSGDGFYARAEYSHSFARYWRLTFAGAGIWGEPGDFLGQYERNSHVSAALRFSF